MTDVDDDADKNSCFDVLVNCVYECIQCQAHST